MSDGGPDQQSRPLPACRLLVLCFLSITAAVLTGSAQQLPAPAAAPPLEFIDTSFENASPLWYDVADGVVRIHLLYDHERSSPNRAAGPHPLPAPRPARLQAHARVPEPGQRLERPAGLGRRRAEDRGASRRTGACGRRCPPRACPGNRVQLHVEMPGPKLYVARIEPYRLSDLDRLLDSIRGHPLVRDHADRQDGRRARPRDRPRRQSGGAVPRLRPRAGASVGVGQQLGRAGAGPAAAEG